MNPRRSFARPCPVRRACTACGSAWYALGLLQRDGPGDAARAQRVLERVLAEQFAAPGQPWDGTFRRAPEEPPPGPGAQLWRDFDPNWRQFIGTTFALILVEFEPRLPAALAARLTDAIRRAVEGELAQGRAEPYHTNIRLLHGFLWSWAGARLDRPAWVAGGERWAEEVAAAFAEHETFEEYNSPTYYGVDLFGLALWRRHGATEKIRALGAQLEAGLWRDIGRFYHAGLRNLAGPFDRAYGMDLRRYVSLTGIWMGLVLPADLTPLPDPAGPMGHAHDFLFTPNFVALGAVVPSAVLAELHAFTGERVLRRPITATRVATAWLAERVMIGGELTGGALGVVPGVGQFHPATIHWRAPGGEVGWVRLYAAPPADAEAGRETLTVRAASPGELVWRVSAPGLTAAQFSPDRWRLPGLDVRVETDAAGWAVAPGDGFIEVRQRGATRAVLHTTVAPPEPPRLAVVIAIDQCRADYLERFRPWFVAGGFRRLLEGGAVFTEARHRHASTATAPGHATLLTGVHADVHGIIANEWFDLAAGRSVSAIEDASSPLVGAAAVPVRLPGGAALSASPRLLLATTVGDQLKLRHGGNARVIGLANKDRAGILLAGRSADAVYWMHAGRFVTSRFYRDELPAWLTAFNAEERINQRFGQTWERSLPRELYEAVQGPDDAPGEEARHGLGVTFPRRIDGGQPVLGAEFYNAYRLDPHSSEVLGALAQRAVEGEQLGRHAAPDLLCLAFSQLDYAGHSFGPDSHELMDSVLRLDRVLAEFFAFLDGAVGTGRWTVVLTADHGVAPLPERVAASGRGGPAGRLDWAALNRAVEAALTAAFGPPPVDAAWAVRDGFGYRLVPATLAAKGVEPAAARVVVQAALRRSPQVAVAWTRDELLDGRLTVGPYLAEWRRSFHAERGPDVVLTPPPYFVDRAPAGSNHGTPHDYDAHVPLVWYGAGIAPGVRRERVGSDAVAPTLAALLGVPRPPAARAELLFQP